MIAIIQVPLVSRIRCCRSRLESNRSSAKNSFQAIHWCDRFLWQMGNQNQNLGGSRPRRWFGYLWHEWIGERRRPIAPAFARPNPAEWSDNRLTTAWLGHATLLINFFGIKILTDPVLFPRIGIRLPSYGRTQTLDLARTDRTRPPRDRHRAPFPRAFRPFRHAHAPSI